MVDVSSHPRNFFQTHIIYGPKDVFQFHRGFWKIYFYIFFVIGDGIIMTYPSIVIQNWGWVSKLKYAKMASWASLKK